MAVRPLLDDPAALGAFLDRLQHLAWPASRRVGGTRVGTHHSRLRGRAPELSEYRLYRQGDDTRDLDWKLLARSDRAFVRLSEDRAVFPSWVLLDASASMAWPAPALSKWRAAVWMTLGVASIVHNAGDPLGVRTVTDGRMSTVPSSTRSDLIPQIRAHCEGIRPSGNAMLASAWSSLPVGGREILVTDLLGDEPECRALAAHRVAAGSEVTVIHVVSSQERDLNLEAALVVDPESPGLRRSLSRRARAEYLEAYGTWREETHRAWAAIGARVTEVVAEDDLVTAMRTVVTAVGS